MRRFTFASTPNIRQNLIKNTARPAVPRPAVPDVKNPLLKSKLFSMRYNEPAEKKMAILLIYFNAQGSLRIINNLLFVKQMLDSANIPYFIGEMSINNSPFLFAKSANIFHFQSPDVMFYKENIINLMEPLLPPIYDKLCIMDADIIIDNTDWYTLLANKLNDVNICQPFSNAYWLNISYDDIIRSNVSYLKDRIFGHEGYVWGFQRAWFNAYKYPLFGFIGSGDSIFVKAVFEREIYKNHEYMYHYLAKYIANLPPTVSSDYLDLTIYHLYHGSIKNRQYVSRRLALNTLLEKLNITEIEQFIKYNAEGVMQWMPTYRSKLNSFMKEHLINRNDDCI